MTEMHHDSPTRYHGLDFLRALMMSLGVVLHTAQIYLTVNAVDYYWDSARSPSMDVLLFFINTFRMPVFFLLSGFFTALLLERRGESAMLTNRWQRIGLPFLIFLPPLALIMTGLRVIARHVMQTGEFGFDPALLDAAHPVWDNTHNLWFLYYLSMHLVTLWLVLAAWRRLGSRTQAGLSTLLAERAIYTRSLLVAMSLLLAALGATEWSGRVTAKLSFVPSLWVYLNFGLCFGFGWLLYWRRQDLEVLASRWRKDLIIASVLFLMATALVLTKAPVEAASYPLQHTLLCLVTGFSIVHYMLGFVGLFCRFSQRHNPWVRYFSDSAYWIFIFHSIPLVAVALLLHDLAAPAEIKFLVVCISTLALCLVSYQGFVRNSAIGQLLNGRRINSTPWHD
ncbi:MAG: acyltransferase family protein [Pseudomonadota bacterium]